MEELNFDPTRDILKIGTKTKHGKGHRQILESEILDAQKLARSANEVSRILGISYPAYARWAKRYGIFENVKNKSGKGISKLAGKRGVVYELHDLIEGKYPDYPVWKLKQRLISHGYLPNKCENCGFDEPRIMDGKVPLIMDFADGDRKNHKFENIRLLCLNCSFLLNGNLTGKRKLYLF